MLQAEFDKIPIGSVVNLITFPQLEGKIMGKDGYMAIVDFPPNNITHSDPEPRPIHYANLGIIDKIPEAVEQIPEILKVALNRWTQTAQDLHNDIAEIKMLLKL